MTGLPARRSPEDQAQEVRAFLANLFPDGTVDAPNEDHDREVWQFRIMPRGPGPRLITISREAFEFWPEGLILQRLGQHIPEALGPAGSGRLNLRGRAIPIITQGE